jgi:hypothetical protein
MFLGIFFYRDWSNADARENGDSLLEALALVSDYKSSLSGFGIANSEMLESF